MSFLSQILTPVSILSWELQNREPHEIRKKALTRISRINTNSEIPFATISVIRVNKSLFLPFRVVSVVSGLKSVNRHQNNKVFTTKHTNYTKTKSETGSVLLSCVW